MSDLISREELLKQIETDSKGHEGQYGDEWLFIDTINSLPTIEERKEGKWEHPHDDEVKCSICGYLTNWIEDTDIHGMGLAVYGEKYANFCPNCGARMKRSE